jgi:hypothetical protein
VHDGDGDGDGDGDCVVDRQVLPLLLLIVSSGSIPALSPF